MLDDFYFADSRLILVPIEHLSPTGLSDEFAAALAQHSKQADAIREFVDGAIARYWERCARLATKSRTWDYPRIRNIAIVDSTTFIPPYVQFLNTTTWTLFDCDFDPRTSSVELVAYLLAHGDRMSRTGEATLAALHNAAYWFGLSDEEVQDFQKGARSSTRPDGEAFAALAEAISWLQQLCHETLRPPASADGYLQITNTGLLVPRSIKEKPGELVSTWTDVAKRAVTEYYRAYSGSDSAAAAEVLEFLREQQPEVVITGQNNRVLWDPDHPDRVGTVRNELKRAGADALRSIRADIGVIDDHSRNFRTRASRFADLPLPEDDIGQDGYTYLLRGRKILAYNLYEAHLERLRTPALPYARSMLGARAYHEWCHLAVDAGWVGHHLSDRQLQERILATRDALDDTLAEAPEAARRAAGADLLALTRTHPPDEVLEWGGGSILVAGATGGGALLRMILPRVADYKANLLAARLQSDDERETYVRQNIRSLRSEFAPPQTWRMFARYMYELQYMRFSGVDDPRTYFLRSTGFEAEFLLNKIVTEQAFDRIDRAFRNLFDAFAIDTSMIAL